MLSKTTKNCWNGSKCSSLIACPSFNPESMTFLMQRLAMFKRFNLSIFHWASRLLSGGELELKVRTKSFPKLSSSLSSSSKFADAILVLGQSADRIYLFVACHEILPGWKKSSINVQYLVSVIRAVLHGVKNNFRSDFLLCFVNTSGSHRHLEAAFRGTQRQFSENICSEDDLRYRIFGIFVVKLLACLPILGFSNI